MNKKNTAHIDEYRNVHIQDAELGRGGQGIVFRTKDPDTAIKLVIDKNGNPLTDSANLEKYRRRFKLLRMLPLPNNITISLPAALLQDKAGYVMQLLNDMVPFTAFFPDPSGENAVIRIPEWLTGMPEQECRKIIHYYETGGLRRRLLALSKCAAILARLHANGLVYGDVSLNNIFVSKDLEHTTVWLIDADNLRFEITGKGSCVYTPRFGAPELVQGKDGGRAASDCHAFAVTAFYTLALIHPFEGEKLYGEEANGWDDESVSDDALSIEDKVYAGFFPWIDDPADNSNASQAGLPRMLILTEALQTLFQATFGKGRTNAALRPAMYHWPKALAQAADITVACPQCSMHYYSTYQDAETGKPQCPYCSTPRPKLIKLEAYYYQGQEHGSAMRSCRQYIREIPDSGTLIIPRRVLGDFLLQTFDEPELVLTITETDIFIKKTEHSIYDFSLAVEDSSDKRFHTFYAQIRVQRSTKETSFWLFTHSDTPRIIRCIVDGGGHEA